MGAAARISDLTNDGAVTGAGVPNVVIGSLPAAVAGDISTPASGSAPAPFLVGSQSVKIGGRSALRSGDKAENSSTIAVGFPTVQIG